MATFEMRFNVGGRRVSVPYGVVTIWHSFPGRRTTDVPGATVFGPGPHPWDPGPHPWTIEGERFTAIDDLALLAAIDELAAGLSGEARAGVVAAVGGARQTIAAALPQGIEYVGARGP